MKNNIIKYLAAIALMAVLITSSALATPTLTIWDDGGTSSMTLATPDGIATYANNVFDAGNWSIVITTAETKPAIGSALSPVMDINVQATSLGTSGHNLHFSWSDDAFGPFNGSMAAILTGHIVTGNGAGVQYNTYYNAGAGVWNTPTAPNSNWTLLTVMGTMPPPTYITTQTGALNQPSFGLDQYVTLVSSPGGSYSVDASLAGNGGEGFPRGVPDGGNTLLLLGFVLVVFGLIRLRLANA
jgi:hypothetical protein